MGEKERNCTREELRFSGQNGWSPCGKTRTQNGPREQRPDFQSGLEKDPAKRPETPRHPRERKVALKMLLKKRSMSMTRKRRSKLKLHKSENIPYISLLPLMKVKIFVNQKKKKKKKRFLKKKKKKKKS